MEMYLSHMVMFRVAEKVNLLNVFGDGVLQYIFSVICVLAETVVFSVVVKKIYTMIKEKYDHRFVM